MFKSSLRAFALLAVLLGASSLSAHAQAPAGTTAADIYFMNGQFHDVSGKALPAGQFTLIAQGGGNLIAQGGGNLIAQGGGNLIGQDGAGLQNGDILKGGMAAFSGRHIFAAGEKRPIPVSKIVRTKK